MVTDVEGSFELGTSVTVSGVKGQRGVISEGRFVTAAIPENWKKESYGVGTLILLEGGSSSQKMVTISHERFFATREAYEALRNLSKGRKSRIARAVFSVWHVNGVIQKVE